MADINLQIQAVPHQRCACPVSVAIDEGTEGPFTVTDAITGKTAPGYCTVEDGTATLNWVLDRLDADEERAFQARPGAGNSEGVVVDAVSDKQVNVSIGGTHFTAYHCGPELARPYCYPLNDATGSCVTRANVGEKPGETTDHEHHRSLWVAYGEANDTDNWSEQEGHGRTVHHRFETSGNDVIGQLTGYSDWVTVDGDPLLSESRRMRFYDVGDHPLRMLDVDLMLQAVNGDVHFGDTKEGGFLSVRVATTMDASGEGRIENSLGGVSEAECWGKRANWCDYSGPVDGHWSGIAVMEHPDTFRNPTYWHVRNYGLMSTNPFGVGAFHGNPDISGAYTLPDGEWLSFSYRVVIHSGTAQKACISDHYMQYINPPQVEVLG
ncbi:uncharacterized protein METZ01_LOCUS195618 [marine metagenome]|uniref:Uncharacterized protein n=1 Tax=marine metagenome TaxID=408172 RepID=A0A382DXZ3_9ZZZZ